ncbi:MAG: ATP synthase epsilon chain [Hyphomicrobiaceae bacterium hypho_1]
MNDFNFELVSPERVLLSSRVEHVVLPGIEGQLGVLPGHLPSLVILKPGIVCVLSGTSVVSRYYVRGGFVDISTSDTVVLAEHAFSIESANRDLIGSEIILAEDKLRKSDDVRSYFSAQSSLDCLKPVQF